MDINLKNRIEEATAELQKLSVWLDSRGEVEIVLAIKNINNIISALVEEINFLEREIMKMEEKINE